MRLRRPVALACAAAFAVAGVAGYGAWRARVRAASRYQAPVFTPAPPGARAPATDFLGVRFGVTHLAEVKARATSWKLTCTDRSMHTMMEELRDEKRREIARAEADGKADTVTGASVVSRRSARDDNPQIRLGCEHAASSSLADRARPPSEGRVLYVLDDGSAVVRHASYQRRHATWAAALADFDDARQALGARFGAGREETSAAAASAPNDALPKYARRSVTWRFTDLVATVTLANVGGHGFSLSEGVEVPLPVRADAPARP